ncbi:MAG: metallophosphoesterase family protein [Thermoprotei archaeon]
MKTLILSDVHYPTGLSSACFEVIRSEYPDLVVLLGDVVVGCGDQMLRNMEEFLDRYPHPLEKSVVLVGDNELRGNRRILELVGALPKLNTDPYTYVFGNMFFTHGNIEGRGALSGLLEEAGGVVARVLKPLTPRIVSSLVRVRNALSKDMYAFVGHIHFLGHVKSTRTVFCGTLSTKKIVYTQEESLGYVVVDHSKSGFIRPGGIRLVSLASKHTRPI